MGKKFLKLLTFLNSKYHKIYCKKDIIKTNNQIIVNEFLKN